MVPAIHHTTKSHKPDAGGKCTLYPTIACEVHESLTPSGDGYDIKGTPATFIAGPDGKVIFGDEEMRKAFSAGATVKKLEEAQRKLGAGMHRAQFEKILKDLDAIDKDIAAEKWDKAVKAVKKLMDAKSIPAAMKEGRLKKRLDDLDAKGAAMLEEAKAAKDVAAAKKVAAQFKGCECAKTAADLVKEWEGGAK